MKVSSIFTQKLWPPPHYIIQENNYSVSHGRCNLGCPYVLFCLVNSMGTAGHGDNVKPAVSFASLIFPFRQKQKKADISFDTSRSQHDMSLCVPCILSWHLHKYVGVLHSKFSCLMHWFWLALTVRQRYPYAMDPFNVTDMNTTRDSVSAFSSFCI